VGVKKRVMKPLFLLFLFLLSGLSFSNELSDSLITFLKVKDTSISFSVTNKNCEPAFFDQFANSNYNKMFFKVSMENWRQKWSKYNSELLKKAYNAHKDTMNLKILFNEIKPKDTGSTAELPIALYFVKQKNKEYMMVIILWGTVDFDVDFGHVKGNIFDMKSKKIVCSMTCK